MKKLYVSLTILFILSLALTGYADWKFSKNVRGTFTTLHVYTNTSNRAQRPVGFYCDFNSTVTDIVTVQIATSTQTNNPMTYILTAASNMFIDANDLAGLILDDRSESFLILRKGLATSTGTFTWVFESSH